MKIRTQIVAECFLEMTKILRVLIFQLRNIFEYINKYSTYVGSILDRKNRPIYLNDVSLCCFENKNNVYNSYLNFVRLGVGGSISNRN